MDMLDLPLRMDAGGFHRTTPEEALQRYVALFFASRKYGARRELDFGVDLDQLAWISDADYLRALVDEFNRVHRGHLSLLVSGWERQGWETVVALTLRHGRSNYRLRIEMGSISGA